MSTRKKKNKNKSQQTIMIGRLIEISLQVDEYIYKNKPIHTATAQEYVKEIATYKPLCSKDPRSLQVIEKLTLFLNNIIQEKCQGTKENTSQIPPETDSNNDEQSIVMPNAENVQEKSRSGASNLNVGTVVTIPVEKKTLNETKQVTASNNYKENESELNIIKLTVDDCCFQKHNLSSIDSNEAVIDDNNSLNTKSKVSKQTLNQTHEISNNYNENFENNIDSNMAFQADSSFKEMNNTKPMECEDTVTQYMNEIDLERTLSNLSLSCFIDPIENNIEKIIESLETSKPQEIEKATIVGHKPKDESEDKSACVQSEITVTNASHNVQNSVYLDISSKILNDRNPVKQCINQRKLFNLGNTTINLNVSEENLLENMNGAREHKIDKLKCIHVFEPSKELAITVPKNLKITKKAVNRKRNKSKSTNSQNKKDQTSANAKAIKTVPVNRRKTKKSSDIEPKLEPKGKKRKNTTDKAESNFTGMDLSWISEIKYVREIGQSEFESVSLGDNFWNDSSVPLSLNDLI